MTRSRKTYCIVLCLLAVVVLSMLYFGFRLKGFRPANNIRWNAQGPGIWFGRYGIAFTEPIQMPAAEQSSSLSMEIALQPGKIGGGIHFVLVVHGGEDADQLLIGQWRSKMMVMHGDDYENRRKIPKIYVDIGPPAEMLLVTIVSGENGTQLFLNGALKKENPALRLTWPGRGRGARLVLANSVYGHNSWFGAIGGLAVYTRELSRQQVDLHYAAWRDAGDFSFARPEAPEMLFLLNEGGGDVSRDQSGNGRDLIIPGNMRILKKEILSRPWQMGRWQWDNTHDAIINFIGFWPLGFLLAAVLDQGRRFKERYFAAAVSAGFVLSLLIEVGQAWIPSRSSSLLDLALNTSGTATAVVLYSLARKTLMRGLAG